MFMRFLLLFLFVSFSPYTHTYALTHTYMYTLVILVSSVYLCLSLRMPQDFLFDHKYEIHIQRHTQYTHTPSLKNVCGWFLSIDVICAGFFVCVYTSLCLSVCEEYCSLWYTSKCSEWHMQNNNLHFSTE